VKRVLLPLLIIFSSSSYAYDFCEYRENLCQIFKKFDSHEYENNRIQDKETELIYNDFFKGNVRDYFKKQNPEIPTQSIKSMSHDYFRFYMIYSRVPDLKKPKDMYKFMKFINKPKRSKKFDMDIISFAGALAKFNIIIR